MRKCRKNKEVLCDTHSRWAYLTEDNTVLKQEKQVCFASLFRTAVPEKAKWLDVMFIDSFPDAFRRKDRGWVREYLTDLKEMGFFQNVVEMSVDNMLSLVVENTYTGTKPTVGLRFDVNVITPTEFLLVCSLVRLVSEYPHFLYVYFRLKATYKTKSKLPLLILAHQVHLEEFVSYYGTGHCAIKSYSATSPLTTIQTVQSNLNSLKEPPMTKSTVKTGEIHYLWDTGGDIPAFGTHEMEQLLENL